MHKRPDGVHTKQIRTGEVRGGVWGLGLVTVALTVMVLFLFVCLFFFLQGERV